MLRAALYPLLTLPYPPPRPKVAILYIKIDVQRTHSKKQAGSTHSFTQEQRLIQRDPAPGSRRPL